MQLGFPGKNTLGKSCRWPICDLGIFIHCVAWGRRKNVHPHKCAQNVYKKGFSGPQTWWHYTLINLWRKVLFGPLCKSVAGSHNCQLLPHPLKEGSGSQKSASQPLAFVRFRGRRKYFFVFFNLEYFFLFGCIFLVFFLKLRSGKFRPLASILPCDQSFCKFLAFYNIARRPQIPSCKVHFYGNFVHPNPQNYSKFNFQVCVIHLFLGFTVLRHFHCIYPCPGFDSRRQR